MQIRVLETPEVQNEGKYNVIMVDYDCDGDTKKQRLVSFGDGERAYKTLVRAKAGDAFEIQSKKNGKYFNWVDAKPIDSIASPAESGTTRAATSRSGTWETADERAAKQVYIIRQTCLERAVQSVPCLTAVSEILDIAKQFEDYVLGKVLDKMPEID